MNRLLSVLPLVHLSQGNLQNIFNQTATLAREIELPSNLNLQELLNEISNGYGCWCNFKKDGHLKGKGKPVDAIDQICRTLHDGYKCSHIDAIEEEGRLETKVTDTETDCSPASVRYNPGILPGSSWMLDTDDPTEMLQLESG